jgi:hypothetical protein
MQAKAKKRINVSGKMKSLEVGEGFTLKKCDYLLSGVRATAYIIYSNIGKRFSVNLAEGNLIRVERTA